MSKKKEKRTSGGGTITEAFDAIKPKGRAFRGIPSPPTIAIGTESGESGATVSGGLSGAGQQIQQLQQAYQQQAALIAANTQALAGNTSSLESAAKGTASSILGGSGIGGLLGGGGLIGDLFSGIGSLFGGGAKTPAPLAIYTPPPPVAISGNIGSAAGQGTGAAGATPAAPATTQNVTLQIQALDSQSILDRSADIATAVRSALLDMHPLGQTIQNL